MFWGEGIFYPSNPTLENWIGEYHPKVRTTCLVTIRKVYELKPRELTLDAIQVIVPIPAVTLTIPVYDAHQTHPRIVQPPNWDEHQEGERNKGDGKSLQHGRCCGNFCCEVTCGKIPPEPVHVLRKAWRRGTCNRDHFLCDDCCLHFDRFGLRCRAGHTPVIYNIWDQKNMATADGTVVYQRGTPTTLEPTNTAAAKGQARRCHPIYRREQQTGRWRIHLLGRRSNLHAFPPAKHDEEHWIRKNCSSKEWVGNKYGECCEWGQEHAYENETCQFWGYENRRT